MIRTGEPNAYARQILFYLPLAADSRLPKTGHVFVLGEVQYKFAPGDPFANVPLVQIVERGGGWYAIELTALQVAVSAVVAYQAVCADAQPDRGTEIIGNLSGDIAEGAAGVLPFFLPDEIDPIYGAPIEGHSFTLGEVQIGLPDDALADVDPSAIVEYGGGSYGVVTTAAQAAKRGKAIVVAEVAGAQRYSGYRTILGEGALVPVVPPPLPLPGTTAAESVAIAGDLLLSWSNTYGKADISRVAFDSSGVAADLAADRGLQTAVILSLFTDRRAENDDTPPSGDPNDRRGWWGDEFLDVEGDRYGSRLWLLDRSKRTNETKLRAIEYAREALAWMIEDRVTSSIAVEVDVSTHALLIGVGLQRPGRDPVSFRFAHTWDGQEAA